MAAEITESRDGVQLEKYFAESEFDLPSVVYELRSERAERATVRIVERIPEPLGPEHIGFHTDFGRQDWSLTEETLVFETDIKGGEEHRSVYALRPDKTYEPERVVTVPDEFTVEQTAAPAAGAGGGLFTRSASTDSGDNGATPQAGTDGEQPPTWQSRPTADRSAKELSLVDQFVAELQAGTVSEESMAYLQQTFDSTERAGSVDARLDQLQSDLADVRTYANAMEQLLDSYGSVGGVVDSFEKRLDCLGAELETLGATVREHDVAIQELRDDLAELEAELDSVSGDVSTVQTETSELESDLSELDEYIAADLDDRIAGIETELSEFTEAIQQAFQA